MITRRIRAPQAVSESDRPRSADDSDLPPGLTGRHRRLVVLVWAACLVPGLLLSLAAHRAGPLVGDLDISQAVQRALPHGGTAGSLLSALGDTAWILPLAAVLVACLTRRWHGALLLLVASLGATLLAELVLPSIVERPRPSAELVEVYDRAGGYGFPSGTAMMALATLGAGAYLVRRSGRLGAASVGATGLLLGLIGLSRVWAGAHWASDVLGGWLLGAAWLLPLLVLYRRLRGRQTWRTERLNSER